MMFGKTLIAGIAAALTVWVAGCATPIPVAEVLQQPQGGKIYTRFNLWYNDPTDIDAKNIQSGRILPIGSEVEVVSCTEGRLVVRDLSGHEYRISFDPAIRMCGIRDFVKMFLSLEPPAKQFEKVNPAVLPYLKRGEVVTGMNRDEVILTYGPPVSSRTPDQKNDTWIYWVGPDQTVRVCFRNEKVRNLINMIE